MDIKLLVATLPGDTKLAPWCRRLGISRQTAYKWRARYRAEGVAGLQDRSRAPTRPARRVDTTVEDAVVAARKHLAEEGLDAGPASVHDRLVAQGIETPSEATLWRILVRRGQLTPQPGKRPKVSYRRFERERPNECWQGDDTHYQLSTGQQAEDPPVLIGACRVGAKGTICPSGPLEIGLGVEWAYRHVTLVRRGVHATVIDTYTGEIIRELTIDPARRYQASGRPPGGAARPRRV